MGADLHTFVEQQQPDGTWERVLWSSDEDHGPFDDRSYFRFGWLAGVRDHDVTPIAAPRGLPDNLSTPVLKVWGTSESWHTPSWLTVAELATFDYDQDAGLNGKYDTPGETYRTYRDCLGPAFFDDLDELINWDGEAPCRIVFWFDS
jgi:hypothetical protein